VKCWGRNDAGQLGNGSTVDSPVPVDVAGLSSGVVAVSSGELHTCVLTSQGGVKCWGFNAEFELGNDSTISSSVPVDVVGLSAGIVAIDAGFAHTCASTNGGGIKCWGANDKGEIGDGTTNAASVPVDVTGLSSGVLAVSAGGASTCALTDGGGVKCWGDNEFGELGDHSTADHHLPIDVPGLSGDIVVVSTGDAHACAVTSGGGVKCWGMSSSVDESTAAVPVKSLSSRIIALSAGVTLTAALTSTGGVKCWGDNTGGALGDGSAQPSAVPVDVVGLSSGVVAVSAGFHHACALSAAGRVKCWGYNKYGELGDGTTTHSTVPVDVVGL
jgi:alpha-tubulin suppressor-like RCC1 family protein